MSPAGRLGWPNRISLARVFCVAPFVIALMNLHEPGRGWLRWSALGLVAVMALSDGLDGWLARRLNDRTLLGAFLDPLADKLLVTAAVVILAVRGIVDETDLAGQRRLYLPDWAAVAAIGKDLLVCIGFAILRMTTGRTHIQPRWIGKTCTTVQLLMVVSMLLWPDLPGGLSRLPQWLWIAATILAVVAALDYVRLGSRILAATTVEPGTPGDGE